MKNHHLQMVSMLATYALDGPKIIIETNQDTEHELEIIVKVDDIDIVIFSNDIDSVYADFIYSVILNEKVAYTGVIYPTSVHSVIAFWHRIGRIII